MEMNMSISNSQSYNIYNNVQNSLLNHITDLNNTLKGLDKSNKQVGYIAKQQRDLIKRYLHNIRYHSNDRIRKSLEGLESLPNESIRSLEISDNKQYKRKFFKKIKDFRINLNVTYIGITSKIHTFYNKAKHYYNELVCNLISFFKYRIPHYIEYKRELHNKIGILK